MTVKITLGNLPTPEQIAAARRNKTSRVMGNEFTDTLGKMFSTPAPEGKVSKTFGELKGKLPKTDLDKLSTPVKMFDSKLSTNIDTGNVTADLALIKERDAYENLTDSTQIDYNKMSTSSNDMIRKNAIALQNDLNNGKITATEFALRIQQNKKDVLNLGGFGFNELPHQKESLNVNTKNLKRFYTTSSKSTFTPTGADGKGNYENSQVSDSMINSVGFKAFETSMLKRGFDLDDDAQFRGDEPVPAAARVGAGGLFGLAVAGYEEIFGERDTYKISSFNADAPIYLNGMILGLHQLDSGGEAYMGSESIMSAYGFQGEDILNSIKQGIKQDLQKSLLTTPNYTSLSEKQQEIKLEELTDNTYNTLLDQAKEIKSSDPKSAEYATSMLEKNQNLIEIEKTVKEMTYSSFSTNYAINQDVENFENYFRTKIKTAFGGEIPAELTGIISQLDDVYVKGIIGLGGQAGNADELNIFIRTLAPINKHVISMLAEQEKINHKNLYDDDGSLSKKNKKFFNKVKELGLIDEVGSITNVLSDDLVGPDFGILSPNAITEARKITAKIQEAVHARFGNALPQYRQDQNRYGLRERGNQVAVEIDNQRKLYQGILSGEFAANQEGLLSATEVEAEKLEKATSDFFKRLEELQFKPEEEKELSEFETGEPPKLDILYSDEVSEDINETISQYNIFDRPPEVLKNFLLAYANALATQEGINITKEEGIDFYNSYISRQRVG